jgi:hypothetical protein
MFTLRGRTPHQIPRTQDNLPRRHYELAVEEPVTRRVVIAFDELALMI